MKIIYSYISNTPPTDLFKKMAEISVASARRTGYDVELYADLQGIDYFRNKTNCEFDCIKLIDVEKYGVLPEYWNFGKLYTYAQQNEPFLHVDFDTVLHDGFTIPEKEIITEMQRPYTMQKEFADVSIFPTNMLPEKLICSGLIGGCDTHIWKELFKHAVKVCKEPIKSSNRIAALIGVEEFNASLLADVYGLQIAELDHNFFTHWQGQNKQQYEQAVNIMYKYYFK